MKYEVGDKVLLLHSNETGEVVGIMNNDMVLVNVDGTEFPVFVDQIDFPYFKNFSDASKRKKEQPEKKKVYIDQIKREKIFVKNAFDNGVHFVFFPVFDTSHLEDDIVHFKLFITNQNTEAYRFRYIVQYKEQPDFLIENEIGGHSDFYLHNITQEEFNDIARFHFEFTLTQADARKVATLEIPLKIKAKTLFQKIDEMRRKNLPSFSFDLFTKYPDQLPEPYFPLPDTLSVYKKNPRPTEPPRSVIDLHIEKIFGAPTGLSNFDIMQIQLAYFEKYYKLAVANMQPKLIVIHGVGTGALRNEIHQILATKKEVKSYVNQYHPDFGFGATEIYFQYS